MLKSCWQQQACAMSNAQVSAFPTSWATLGYDRPFENSYMGSEIDAASGKCQICPPPSLVVENHAGVVIASHSGTTQTSGDKKNSAKKMLK